MPETFQSFAVVALALPARCLVRLGLPGRTRGFVVTAESPRIITLFPCEELMVANEY
jgi:hypothetical protein